MSKTKAHSDNPAKTVMELDPIFEKIKASECVPIYIKSGEWIYSVEKDLYVKTGNEPLCNYETKIGPGCVYLEFFKSSHDFFNNKSIQYLESQFVISEVFERALTYCNRGFTSKIEVIYVNPLSGRSFYYDPEERYKSNRSLFFTKLDTIDLKHTARIICSYFGINRWMDAELYGFTEKDKDLLDIELNEINENPDELDALGVCEKIDHRRFDYNIRLRFSEVERTLCCEDPDPRIVIPQTQELYPTKKQAFDAMSQKLKSVIKGIKEPELIKKEEDTEPVEDIPMEEDMGFEFG